MRFLKAFIPSVLVVIMCVFCLTACTGITGSYKLASMTIGEETVNVGETYEGEELKKDFLTFKIEKDNKYTITAKDGDETDTVSGTYTERTAGEYTMLLLDNGDYVTINDKTLIWNSGSVQYKFERKFLGII